MDETYDFKAKEYVDKAKPALPIERIGPFYVGQLADHVLVVMKKTGRRPLRAPEKVGDDTLGHVVKWFLLDATLTLKRAIRNGPYVISHIEPAMKGGENV